MSTTSTSTGWATSGATPRSFFAFADTVVARSYRGGNECHGWMGVKFQAHPHDEPSQIVLHVRMLDSEAALQQEALGIVGVNLLYGAFFEHHEPEQLVESLLDGLTTDRIEIDMIQFRGHRVPQRRQPADGPQAGPDRPERGGHVRPRPRGAAAERGAAQEGGPGRAGKLPADRRSSTWTCSNAPGPSSRPTRPWPASRSCALTEITMRNLLAGGDDVDRRDFLARADLLGRVRQ